MSVGVVAVLATAATAFGSASRPAGSVHQAPGKAGCYSADGSSAAGPATCRNIRGGTEATTLTISPDARFAYLVGYGHAFTPPLVPPVLSAFRRNPRNGALHQLSGKSGCFSIDGSSEDGPNTCYKARDLNTGDATSIVISRDGRFLYVASQLTQSTTEVGGIAVFARNLTTGKLHQLKGKAGCVTAVAYKGCAIAREVTAVSNLHFSPDHKYLYASDYDSPPHSGIAIFKLDSKNGTLHQLKGKNGCLSDDGTTIPSGLTKVCRAMPNLSDPWDIATPDNRFAYVPAAYNNTNLVQAFKRTAQGGLVPVKGKRSCVSDTGLSPAGSCVHGRGLFNPERAVLSKNDRFLYVASYMSPSPIAVLNRNPKTGLLSERPGTAACISLTGASGDGSTCRNGRALDGAYAGALSPNGKTLYFPEFSSNALVIFRISPKTGAFKQLRGKFGCVTPDGSSEDGAHTCEKGRAIEGAYQVALASKGHDVYVAGSNGNGVALFYANK
jgi:6-phosphogluconolactonase (cycloisomerase 2 family)